ncbi:axonemal dynein light chain domain-containing protein 1 isoform X2 [Spea bombifrons]|uniref:axonemal dynein light chain domain-containing protein 1 isoform X2 n=1 Tax=Spea bombifrons TaxID=233779 RepID=UPI00234B0F99|nr:axonemal dynein light chain domain-containing protein 1 isoform X2 [Spea bombifrons]
MSLTDIPSPPVAPRTAGRRMMGSRSLVPFGEEMSELPNKHENSGALEQSKAFVTSLQNDYVPDEIVQALTSTAHPIDRPDHAKKMKSATKVCLRSADQVWHHPSRRSRFKHLTDQPICLTGAGRDISFLCDALLLQKNTKDNTSEQPAAASNMLTGSTGASIEDSLLPKEFYVVKNKGVLGLEYYEDKYTTLLEDDEKKLRVFPSMKPSGRSEVLQLMKVMDTMLKEAGVDEEDIRMEGPTQIHNLLELLKTEQKIYNIVFHEIIRQVSVECAERGELLAKLRQRYVMLLNKIPRQVLSLYNDLLAQRTLDRCLTEEIINFKNAMGELTNELCQVREHDLRVSKDAKQAQEELAKALKDAKKKANLLEEYRELYELQRSRLEKSLGNLTEERDLWSSATYRLARKVIEENQLKLSCRLYMNEKTWTKTIRHFIVLLASNDTVELSKIQEMTESWRRHMAHFDQEVQRKEESSREKLRLICSDLEKWHRYFQEKVFIEWHYHGVPEEASKTILQDLKSWKNMANEELQQFEGNVLLNNQESLQIAAGIQKQWFQLGEKLLNRHRTMDGDQAPEQKAMEDVNNRVRQLSEQYRRRVEGENGVAGALVTFCGSLESWSQQLYSLKAAPHGIRESDWLNVYQQIPEWITLADRALCLIGSPSSGEEPTLNPDEKVLLEDVFRMVQQWVLATSSGTERDITHLTHEVSSLHTAMVQHMVNTLILLTPDYPSESGTLFEFVDEEVTDVTAQQLQEEALTLYEKVNRFSYYIISCCQEMVEKISMEKAALTKDDPDYDLGEIETIKNSCKEWIETCQLLTSHITAPSVSSVTSLSLNDINSSEGVKLQVRTARLQRDAAKLGNDGPSESPREKKKETIPTQQDQITQTTRPATKEIMASEQDVMRVIGHDGNIHKKPLMGEESPVSPENALKASRPGTPRSIEAFDSLISLEQMQKRLLLAEQRAQEAEERSECLDEQLKIALQKIQELEKIQARAGPREESSKEQEELSTPSQVSEPKITPVTQIKKRTKSGKVKQQK